MFEKPDLSNAEVIKSHTKEELLSSGIPLAVAEYILSKPGKEYNTGDIGVGSLFKVLGQSYDCDYVALKTEGTSNTLSLFRLVGGCNNINAFEAEGVEISEDYDSISPDRFVNLSSDYDEAIIEALKLYKGKTLRVVARTAPETAPYDRRYYLFVVDD